MLLPVGRKTAVNGWCNYIGESLSVTQKMGKLRFFLNQTSKKDLVACVTSMLCNGQLKQG
jgi:hypothetical protein